MFRVPPEAAHFFSENVWGVLPSTVEPLIKDILNKGHLCVKDTFHLYYTFLPLKENNLSIMDIKIRPNVSVIQRFHCIWMVSRSFICHTHMQWNTLIQTPLGQHENVAD